MTKTSSPIRKRDKLKQKLCFCQSSSHEAPRSPLIRASSVGPAPSVPSVLVHSSSAASKAVDKNAGNKGSDTLSYGISTTDSIAKSSTQEPQDLTIEQITVPRSSPINTDVVPSSTLVYGTACSMNNSPPILPRTETPQPRDLWEKAFQKISSGDQEAIWGLKTSLSAQKPFSETIQELLGLTTKVQDECKAKSCKFLFKGKEIIVRDVAGKIIFWLNKFKEVGDIAVNFDPIHASLPWAGVRFLLQAAIAEHEQMGYLVTATEKLSCLISRGTILERLYQPGTISEDVLARLDQALLGLYGVMLGMIALCHRLLAKNTAKRVVHAIFNPAEICELLDHCEKLEVQVDFEAHNCERARSKETDEESKRLLEILQEPVLRTDQNVLRFLEKVSYEERLKVLDWISDVRYGLNHQRVKEQRTAETCDWLLSHGRYREWQDTSASIILWLWGTAGTGKTFITSKIIDANLIALKSKPNQEGFAFFYCNRNEAERREPLSVLRAFVRQLSSTPGAEGSIQKRLKEYYNQCRVEATGLTMGDCKSLLLDLVNTYPRTTLVLDALDECEKHKRLDLIAILDHVLTEASNPIKIFISSRPDGDIKERLKDRANIGINATDNQDDISRFVKSEIIKHRRWGEMSAQLQTTIVETLQEKSQGMFQWAFLQIKQLLDLHRPGEISDRLGKLPKDLKQAYDEIYDGMEEHEKKIADRAFQWVMCAIKPLETKVILPAICQDENSDTLAPLDGLNEDLALEYCHNLLVIDPVRKVWVPSHLSVIEYLEDRWSLSQANCLVSSICLLVLQNTILYSRERSWLVSWREFNRSNISSIAEDDSEEEDASTGARSSDPSIGEDHQNTPIRTFSPRGIEQTDPLHKDKFKYLALYARCSWMLHAQRSAEAVNKQRVSTLLYEFLGHPSESSAAYRLWLRMVIEDCTSEALTHRQQDVWSVEPEDLEPHSASSFVYCLFDLAINLPDWYEFEWLKLDQRTSPEGYSCLEIAIMGGSCHTCHELINQSALVNQQTRSSCGSALAAAAYHGEREIVKYLVEEGGADVNMLLEGGGYGSALAAAAGGRYPDPVVVEFLVRECRAEVNVQLAVGGYGSALAAAACGEDLMVVEFLVREGRADVNMQLQYGYYGSALAAAANSGNPKVVEFLVKEGGADVNMRLQYGNYGSALAAAANSGNPQVVEFLVKEGEADVNLALQGGDYGSALAAAAIRGDLKVVEFLVKEGGADVNMQLKYGNYGSALAAAASGGKLASVGFLVEEGRADVNMQLQYGYYGSTLAAAIRGRYPKVVEFLVKEGRADVNMQLQYGDYGSVLAAAAAAGYRYDDVVVDDYRWGVLKESIEFLVKEARADIHMQLEHGKYANALEAAEKNSNYKIAQLLIELGATRQERKHVSLEEEGIFDTELERVEVDAF